MQPVLFSFDNSFNSSICAAVSPVVPITGFTLAFKYFLVFSKTADGSVKSTTTSGLLASRALSKSLSITTSPNTFSPVLNLSTAITRVISPFCSLLFITVFTTSLPILPRAPVTPTLITKNYLPK